MRARKKPWTKQFLNGTDRLVANPQALRGQWPAYFGNAHPIWLEIGCGKGRFITATAERYPDVNCVALEKEPEVAAFAIRAAATLALPISFIINDAQRLEEYFAPGEINRLFLNFSDPWRNKAKWHKRRLTHASFLQAYARILTEGGQLHFKTDNPELFDFSLHQLNSEGWHCQNITRDLHRSPFAPENILTEYEERFAGQGKPIYRLEAVRPTTPQPRAPVKTPGWQGLSVDIFTKPNI